MVTINDITSTTLRGLGIGVLAGVSSNVLKNVGCLYPTSRKRKKRYKKRKR